MIKTHPSHPSWSGGTAEWHTYSFNAKSQVYVTGSLQKANGMRSNILDGFEEFVDRQEYCQIYNDMHTAAKLV